MVRAVTITRYVTPLWEGSSLPALVEANDGREYVIKSAAPVTARRH